MISISVVIPAYNASGTIAAAVQSVTRQSFRATEIIIVDDGKNAHLEQLVGYTDIPLRVISHERNRGVSAARNTGWRNASGDFVAFLDSDDTWHPDKLSLIAAWLELFPDTALLGHAFTDDEKELGGGPSGKPRLLSTFNFLWRNRFQGSSMIVKKSLPWQFDEHMRFSEDFDFALQVSCRHYPVYFSDQKLTLLSRRQLTEGGLSGNRAAMRLGEMRAYRKLSGAGFGWGFLVPFLVLWSALKHLRNAQ